ncbi:Thiamin biosynthesis lipoprotein ApbE [Streptococcus gordonii]|uniref:FAD:protein FMN transferase n=1 Tax=Streptococcus gordonii TaxID=1302 RepID=A0A139NB79_STRGN|nr:Thiamin biosynthesis lipoprotein ApbE [Streptococcus gordonii]
MGSTISISILHENADFLLDEVFSLLKIYENRFSANDDSSELMQVNHAAGKEPICVHPDLFELIELGKKHSLIPGSHLNITIGPLIQTWRIGFKDARVPSASEIEKVLSLTNPENIELNPISRSVFLKQSGMKIDLGALAKGYIADKISYFLKEKSVTSALINLGGNILTIGQNQQNNRLWRIGIQNPKLARGNNLALLSIQDQSVVTSGIYERKLKANGKVYHHIFDRNTGYPIDNQLASLTIVSDKSVDGEIWTTRLFGDSPSSILEKVEQENGIEAFVITEDNQIFYSSGLTPEIIS